MPNENTDRLARIEAKADRIEKLLVAIWDQQQRTKHAPVVAAAPQPNYTLDAIAEAIAQRHPKQKTLSATTVGAYLANATENMVNPEASANAINRHHAWRCKYEWSTAPATMVPYLGKWLRERACDPCPTDAEGEAMLRGPERMSRAERDIMELQREMGG